MNTSALIITMLILPLCGSALSLAFRKPWPAIATGCTAVIVATLAGVFVLTGAAIGSPQVNGWYCLDSLAAFHLGLLMAVFLFSSVFALFHFRTELIQGELDRPAARRFATLWPASFTSMTLVLIANNIGIMWMAMEATTLLTAFLICVHPNRAAVEAMWKYLIICSVGIAFAFMGTLLINAATIKAGSDSSLIWTGLMSQAHLLNPLIVKTAFVFSIVGFGTKAGLAPMHTWLPDAHSQSPAPVSAMFSGFMLNAALYCIMRHAALVNACLGSAAFTGTLFIGFGMASLLIAAAFIMFQEDLKRLLAYCSVEHIGIICLGLGLGPAGTAAALLHTMNHSLAKTTSFFAAGRIVNLYRTHSISAIRGAVHAAPLWGWALAFSLMALTGVAPFAIFVSEFLTFKAAIELSAIWTLLILFAGTFIVFVAIMRRMIHMAWGEPPLLEEKIQPGMAEKLFFIVTVGLLLFFGLWLPGNLFSLIRDAARIAGGLQ